MVTVAPASALMGLAAKVMPVLLCKTIKYFSTSTEPKELPPLVPVEEVVAVVEPSDVAG